MTDYSLSPVLLLFLRRGTRRASNAILYSLKMTPPKRISILTSGGDCAGLNAAIRVVDTYGWEVVGIYRATQGLMERPVGVVKLTIPLVDRLLVMGGTYLGTTNQGNPFAFAMLDGEICNRTSAIIEGYHHSGLDALVSIGDDGSLAILRKIATAGRINFVAIPKTIDNDVGAIERSSEFGCGKLGAKIIR